MYKRELVNSTNIRIKHWLTQHTKIKDYTKNIAQKLIKVNKRVDIKVAKMKKIQKDRFDRNKIDNPFKVNNFV